jgi:alpha-L-fucosidase 2
MKTKSKFLILLLFCCATTHFSLAQNLTLTPSPHDLNFDHLPTSWDEGIPLGNGILGALIWQKDGKLRISLDRADLWDLRPMKEMYDSTFTWPWIIQKVKEKDYAPVQQMGDVPYEREAGPTKLPGAAAEINISKLGEIESVHLFIEQAVCEIKWKGGQSIKVYVHADKNLGFILYENFDGGAYLVAPPYVSKDTSLTNSVDGQSLSRLGYRQGLVPMGCGPLGTVWNYHQPTFTGHHYAKLYSRVGNKSVWTIHRMGIPEISFDDNLIQSHLTWWRTFWQKSAITLPDKTLEKQWYLEQYKYGCTARSHAPPISLQAIWTADNGKLPPWKGDFHHDLNTQLSYWPAYSGNHLEEEIGYLNWLDRNRPSFQAYTERFFQAPGINVPGVTTLTGEPMGGWIQYSMSPTISAWLAQHFYLHWRYTLDRDFLEKRAYPWLHDVAVFLEKITVKRLDGKRQLPISSSPEIHDNSLEAWFLETTNYDLALMRFAFEKAAELALELGKKDEANHWKSILSELPDYALTEAGGLMFAPGEPYAESHRHFSHLMAWHPLGLLDWSKEEERRTINATLADLEKYGSDYWVGYSFAWLGNLYARAHNGEKAAEALRNFAQCFCLPNSFHVNGDQCGHLTKMHYRPFTLEGNFAFAAGVQEMLLQSHTGVIEVFPAVPADWQEVSFENLRAEGAVLVSAKKEKGQVVEIQLVAEQGGVVRLRNVFPGGVFRPAKTTKFYEDGVIEFELKKGEKIVLQN